MFKDERFQIDQSKYDHRVEKTTNELKVYRLKDKDDDADDEDKEGAPARRAQEEELVDVAIVCFISFRFANCNLSLGNV